MCPIATPACWMALAFRSGRSGAEKLRIALGGNLDEEMFPRDVLDGEQADYEALKESGISLLTLADAQYPARLRGEDAPLVLQVAGRQSLLNEEGVCILPYRSKAAPDLAERIDSGERVVVVLSKGLLKARTLLRALAEPIADGQVALVSAEPPRASWGPMRDLSRDRLTQRLKP
jgi:predicted Rossmann fold nucleotide-binding protein DprA/Smf involved in DNA uptake